MSSDPNALVYDFRADLSAFGDEVVGGATKVLQEGSNTTFEAIVLGNEFGPGVAVDTGFARSSFRVGINQVEEGPSEPPGHIPGRRPGVPFMGPIRGDIPIARAQLGDQVFITTVVEYPQFLEFEPKTRRYGPLAGQSTEFLDPVEARFTDIIDDAADRVGYGR
mgnify:CR=1 FL=1